MSLLCPPVRGTREVLSYISRHLEDHGIGPSIPQIQRKFGWKSRNSVVQILDRLKRERLLVPSATSKYQYERVLLDPPFPETEAYCLGIEIPVVVAKFGEPLPMPDQDDMRAKRYWIDRRLFGSMRGPLPFVVQLTFDLDGPFPLRSNQTLVLLPWKEAAQRGRCWVLATIDGRMGAFWASRRNLYTVLKRVPGNRREKPIEATRGTIHGKILAALFAEPHHAKQARLKISANRGKRRVRRRPKIIRERRR